MVEWNIRSLQATVQGQVLRYQLDKLGLLASEHSPLQGVEQLHGLDVAGPVTVRGGGGGVAWSLAQETRLHTICNISYRQARNGIHS